MQIRPTSNAQSTSSVSFQTQNTNASQSADALPADQLDISAEAQMMSATTVGSEIRADRVADIRAQIASGQYETSEKLDAAISRMLDAVV